MRVERGCVMKEEGFDRLVGLIYESALDPGRWRDTMNELAGQVGADTFHLLGWNSRERAPTLGVMSHDSWNEALDLYNRHYGSVDPRLELALKTGPGVVIACHRYFDDRFVAKDEFYQDFLLRFGLRYVLGGCLAQNADVNVELALLRAPRHGFFEPEQESLLARLMPHFNRSLRLMDQTQAAARAGEFAVTGQAAVSLAAIAIGRSGRVLYCNRQGDALLRAGQILRVINGALVCADSSRGNAWAECLDAVSKSGRPANLWLAGSEARYSVTLMPMPKRGEFSLEGTADGVLCLVVPLDQRRVATARQLVALFGLSAAEARLVRALAAGETLENYARESDLKMPTVKTQLRMAFEKTGVSRQAALVRLIAAIPAVREPG